MKVHLVSFATTYKDIGFQDTELRQQRLIESAKQYGIHSFFSWTRQMLLKTDFYQQNKFILDHKIGAGYWLWKPFIILDTLEKVAEGDIIIYADNSMYFIDNPMPLMDICIQENDILLFKHNNDSTLKKFVQKSTFDTMEADYNLYKDRNMFEAGILIFQKNQHALSFVKEWLMYCQNPMCLMENYQQENENFKLHKHDMSILSLLAQKYNINGYRVPHQYGNQHKMLAYRKEGEEIFKNEYHDINFDSHYPTIFQWDKDGVGCKRTFFQKINPVFIYYKLFYNKLGL